jgi:Sulfotransferase domain
LRGFRLVSQSAYQATFGDGEFGSLDEFACRFASHWAQELTTAQNFANRYPDCIRQVQYEDLVTNAVPVLSELFWVLGVPASHAIAERCLTEASFANLSGGRNPGDEDRRSFFRKGVPGDWRNHLDAETNAHFQRHAGGWLHRFGYG